LPFDVPGQPTLPGGQQMPFEQLSSQQSVSDLHAYWTEIQQTFPPPLKCCRQRAPLSQQTAVVGSHVPLRLVQQVFPTQPSQQVSA